MANTSLAPFQAPAGLSPREALAHMHHHLEKVTRKHDSAVRAVEAARSSAKAAGQKTEHVVHTNLNVITNALLASGVGAGLGYVNTRYGGDKGHIEKFGVSLDFGLGLVAHGVGVAFALRESDDEAHDARLRQLSSLLHTIGSSAMGASAARWGSEKAVEAMQHAAMTATAAAASAVQMNGARPAAPSAAK